MNKYASNTHCVLKPINSPRKYVASMPLILLILLTALLGYSKAAMSDEGNAAKILVLDFELNDLTLHPDTSQEEKRVKTLRPLLTTALQDDLNYSIATLPQADRDKEDKGKGYIFDRPEVSARMARAAGADWAVSGRLHKASFLFVYLKAQLINATSGEIDADFVVEIKGWEPRLTKKGVDALALQIDESIRTIIAAVDKADYVNFFNDYQRLSSEFDASINTLYTDDAKIMGARKKPDGTEENMTIDGSRWKTIILSSMERAKQANDLNEYSNVAIEVDGDQAKISASRYSNLNCFTDDRFYMIVKSTAANELKIVEQFTESAAKSNCEGSDTDLSEFLQSTVKMINEQLPAAVDAETQLVKTSTEGKQLTYHYVLVNYTVETLTTDVATATLQPLVIQQSCNSPNLRPILDQGGSLAYIYKGSDAVDIAKLDVDISACN